MPGIGSIGHILRTTFENLYIKNNDDCNDNSDLPFDRLLELNKVVDIEAHGSNVELNSKTEEKGRIQEFDNNNDRIDSSIEMPMKNINSDLF